MCKDRSASRSRRCCALTPSARIGSVLSRGRHHSLERQEPAALARVLTVGWLVDSASPAIHLVMPATGSPAVLRALAGLRLSIAEPNYPQRVTGVDGEAPHPQSSAPSALRRRLVCGALLCPNCPALTAGQQGRCTGFLAIRGRTHLRILLRAVVIARGRRQWQCRGDQPSRASATPRHWPDVPAAPAPACARCDR